MSDFPARLYGLLERGRIAEGWVADLVLFDPATVGPGAEHELKDLPGGAKRISSTPSGMHRVFVNGSEVVRDGKMTGRLGGSVLRSGRDSGKRA